MAQYNPTVFGLLLTITATAATAAACPAGWTPAPNASWANQCFGVPAGRSSSLRSCVELCSTEGGVPACIASAEENGFAAELLGNETAWLGLYQNDTSGGVDEGWGRCVASDAPSFSSWRAGEPNDFFDFAGENCAFMFGSLGTWADVFCASIESGTITHTIRGFRCLCAGPANASAAFPDDLEALEAAVEAALDDVRANVAVAYPIATLIALLPALLLLGRRALLRLRSGGAAAGDGDGAPPSPPPRTALAPTASPRRATQGAARPTRPPRRRQASSARRAARPRSGGCK